MYCGKCGNPLNELDKFCRVCGAEASAVGTDEYKKNDYAERREEGAIEIDVFLHLGKEQEDAIKAFQQKYGDLIAPAKNTYKDNKEEGETPKVMFEIPAEEKQEKEQSQEWVKTEPVDSEAIPQFLLEERKPKKRILKKVGIFILVIAVAVGAVIGIGYLWPDIIDLSGMMGSVQDDREKTEPENADSKDKKEKDAKEQDRTVLAEDTTEILQGLQHLAPNIEKMRWNSLLKIDLKGTYEDSNIVESGQIINNVWKKDSEGIVYYDESLLKAIIEFESKRADYVNDADQKVFDYVTLNGPAYEKLKASSPLDDKETVKLLELGEIRRFENTFYVCSKITTEINKTKEQKEEYSIYRLYIVDGQLKVDHIIPCKIV